MLISKKRNKIDIIKDAVEYAKEDTTKTSLILRLNVGWKNGEKIINLLLSKNLIREIIVPFRYNVTRYAITPEGVSFLDSYNKITCMLDYEICSED
jgi:predicted transcriptional regulator